MAYQLAHRLVRHAEVSGAIVDIEQTRRNFGPPLHTPDGVHYQLCYVREQIMGRIVAITCHNSVVMHVLRVPIFEDSGCCTRLVGWEEEIRISSVPLDFEQMPLADKSFELARPLGFG